LYLPRFNSPSSLARNSSASTSAAKSSIYQTRWPALNMDYRQRRQASPARAKTANEKLIPKNPRFPKNAYKTFTSRL
jgi:hypothetical protein